MREAQSTPFYIKGVNGGLDKELSEYKRIRIWAGEVWKSALSVEEGEIMLELWRKERLMPSRMTINEVSTLMVAFNLVCFLVI